ncbi:MAG TPA: L,D-transpeptidase family protein [Gammaproteobacteria bacterium]|nr:L,D-transpeptidase family protein [Gammaproteobacteria bacterium]
MPARASIMLCFRIAFIVLFALALGPPAARAQGEVGAAAGTQGDVAVPARTSSDAAAAIRTLSDVAVPARALSDVAGELKRRVEQLRVTATLTIGGETILASRPLLELYEARAFAPLWAGAGASGRESAAAGLDRALRDIAADGLDPNDYHARGIASLEAGPKSASSDAELDLLRTDALLRIAEHLRYGKVDEATLSVNRDLTRPLGAGTEVAATPPLGAGTDVAATPPLGAGTDVAATVLDMLESGLLYDRVMALRPSHFVYSGLVAALAGLEKVRAEGGWPAIPAGRTLRIGDEDPRVPLLRRRLADDVGVLPSESAPFAVEDLPSLTFDSVLEAAVKSFQRRHSLNEDGVVGAATLAELNVPAEARIQQVRVNLERARWVAHDLADTFVVVNIAGAKVYYVRGGNVVFETRAVVGLPYRQTPVFSAPMRYIDLNPTWTVPPGIVGEILAHVRRDPGYLDREHFRVLDRAGNPVDAGAIDYARYNASNFPYVFRQQPGPSNPLGNVKLVFPNRYNVYLHDTPARELFEREQRTFSHGCIRVQDPLRLAELVLDDPEHWSRAALEAAMAPGTTRTIALPKPISVLVLYWTASADVRRELHFFRDVYGRDAPVLRALDEPYS